MKENRIRERAWGASRREFLKQALVTPAAATLVSSRVSLGGVEGSGAVSILVDPADSTLRQAPVRWAVGQLQEALQRRRLAGRIIERMGDAPQGEPVVFVAGAEEAWGRRIASEAGVSLPQGPESLLLAPGRAQDRPLLLLSGSDPRGITYALLEAADRVSYVSLPLPALFEAGSVAEAPANSIRSLTRYFESDVEDKSWFYDRAFWGPYLSMLAANRFNRFSLAFGLGYNRPRDVHDAYFYFLYPFLFSLPGYSVKVSQLAVEERDQNFAMLQWISQEVTSRGLDFQLAIWTHAYQWIDSPRANYTVEGLTPETHAAYCRDALRYLLESCPAIRGVTLRAHSESGIPEGSYDFWREVFAGTRVGRPVEIDIHAKGIEHKLIQMALETGNPVNVSPKYWAEHLGLAYHQASIRDLERNPPAGAHGRIEQERRFTRYGYGDYLREDREYGVLYRIWPGTQRVLLWGDPALAAGYGRYSHLCGSLGVEVSDPLSFKGRMGSGRPGGRNGYADPSLRPSADWQKHTVTYRIWGRLLYNPDTSPDSWRRLFRHEYGAASFSCERALAHASRILPLVTTAHHPSASNNRYWPEMYTNMPIVDPGRPHPYGDTPEPRRFGTVSSLDPILFSSVEEFSQELLQGKGTGRYSPLDVARWLEADARAAEEHLARARARIEDPQSPSFRRLAVDVGAQASLGRFFAEKLRAATAYALYEGTGDPAFLERALKRYRAARDAWKQVVELTRGTYVEDLTYGRDRHLRGHWADRLPAIEADLADMEARKRDSATSREAREQVIDFDRRLQAGEPIHPRCEHLPPAFFHPGRPVELELTVEEGYQVHRIRVFYRHVNQAEDYQIAEMKAQGGRYRLTIDGAYTRSPYPLLYFFELENARREVWLYPGFRADLSNQPYYVIRQEGGVGFKLPSSSLSG